jgi:hypothetical protein
MFSWHCTDLGCIYCQPTLCSDDFQPFVCHRAKVVICVENLVEGDARTGLVQHFVPMVVWRNPHIANEIAATMRQKAWPLRLPEAAR